MLANGRELNYVLKRLHSVRSAVFSTFPVPLRQLELSDNQTTSQQFGRAALFWGPGLCRPSRVDEPPAGAGAGPQVMGIEVDFVNLRAEVRPRCRPPRPRQCARWPRSPHVRAAALRLGPPPRVLSPAPHPRRC